jgi:hypothetical protein
VHEDSSLKSSSDLVAFTLAINSKKSLIFSFILGNKMGRLRDFLSSKANQIFPDQVKKIKSAQKILKTVRTARKALTPGSGSGSGSDNKKPANDVYANLSSLAYEQDSSKKARRLGYSVDRELSNENHTVFVDRKTKQVVISYRGTNPKNIDDLAADADIARGKREHSRFRQAVEVADRASKKYGDDKIELTGHSLGGTQALYVYEKRGHKTRVFNPGSNPLGEQLKKHSSGKQVDIVRHQSDVISSGWAKHATHTYGDAVDDFLGVLSGDKDPIGWQSDAHSIPA